MAVSYIRLLGVAVIIYFVVSMNASSHYHDVAFNLVHQGDQIVDGQIRDHYYSDKTSCEWHKYYTAANLAIDMEDVNLVAQIRNWNTDFLARVAECGE